MAQDTQAEVDLSLEEQENARNAADSFNFNKHAAEFVPQAPKFQFNPEAVAFQFNPSAASFSPGPESEGELPPQGAFMAAMSLPPGTVGVYPVMAVQGMQPGKGMRLPSGMCSMQNGGIALRKGATNSRQTWGYGHEGKGTDRKGKGKGHVPGSNGRFTAAAAPTDGSSSQVEPPAEASDAPKPEEEKPEEREEEAEEEKKAEGETKKSFLDIVRESAAKNAAKSSSALPKKVATKPKSGPSKASVWGPPKKQEAVTTDLPVEEQAAQGDQAAAALADAASADAATADTDVVASTPPVTGQEEAPPQEEPVVEESKEEPSSSFHDAQSPQPVPASGVTSPPSPVSPQLPQSFQSPPSPQSPYKSKAKAQKPVGIPSKPTRAPWAKAPPAPSREAESPMKEDAEDGACAVTEEKVDKPVDGERGTTAEENGVSLGPVPTTDSKEESENDGTTNSEVADSADVVTAHESLAVDQEEVPEAVVRPEGKLDPSDEGAQEEDKEEKQETSPLEISGTCEAESFDVAKGSVTRYTVAVLKAMRSLGSSCPSTIPSTLRLGEDGDRKRYRVDFLRDMKDKTECQDLPANHRIPRDILNDDQSPTSPSKRMDGDDWRSQQVKYQAKRERERSNNQKITGRKEEKLVALAVSENSWAMKQQASKENSDEVVARKMKAILNKLTVEKFDALSEQLCDCGIRTDAHIMTLMREVFEKATTQHHFIDMYTKLCIKLHEWTSEKGLVSESGEKVSFKRLLLDQCQNSFETYLRPPEGLDELTGEEAFEARVKYKRQMLGNMKFVAQLLIHKVLSSKIILTCVTELLQSQSEETLETLCVFLTAVGPVFDHSGFKGQEEFARVFSTMKDLACSKSDVAPRIKCLMRDVMDLRASGWTRRHTHNQPEGPKALSEVKHEWAKDYAEKDRRPGKIASVPRLDAAPDEWETVGTRKGVVKTVSRSFPSAPQLHQSRPSPSEKSRSKVRDSDSKFKSQGPPSPMRERKSESNLQNLHSPLRSEGVGLRPGGEVRLAPSFDSKAFRKSFANIVSVTGICHDLEEATTRFRELKIPLKQQKAELPYILSQVVEARTDSRPPLFRLLVRLFTDELLSAVSVAEGLEQFMTASYPELLLDLPQLPQIVEEELLPCLRDGLKKTLPPDQLSAVLENTRRSLEDR